MSLLNLNIQKWVLTNLKFNFITCLVILVAFSAPAQLPGQLPVNLKAFKARAENNDKVKVFWTTEYEKDNGFFDIERSTDAVNFTLVGSVAGVNRNGHLTDYIFYDKHAIKGISFYRLKQVDVDRKFSYSPIERVRNADTDNSFDVYPNPALGNEFKVNLLKNVPGAVDVLIFDLGGRLQMKQQFSNNNTFSVNHDLPAGVYTVKIAGKAFAATKKLVLQ